LLSDKVTQLVTESVSVAVFAFGFVVFECIVLHLIAHVLVVADIANEWKVEIDMVNNKSSWIIAIMDAGVEAPNISNSTLVSGKIRSVLYINKLVISWSAFIATH